MTDACGEQWRQWLDQHGPALVLLARRWAGTHAAAEDIVQEAFIRFWRTRRKVRDPAAYLFSSVRRTAMELHRSEQRRHRRHERQWDAAATHCEILFEAPLCDREREATVAEALRGLPVEQYEVVVMKIWGGLTFAQIADALRVSANTAASRYRYALKRLRGLLEADTI